MHHYGPEDKQNITQHFLQVMDTQQQYIKTEDVNIYKQFISICTHTLQRERDNFLLAGIIVKENNVNDKPDLPLNGKQEGEPDKEATKARQLLVMYYLLKTSGIEHRQNNSVSAVARFIHLLTGTKFTNIQNSDIYKKYLLMPNYKKSEQLIKDLQYIRPYFEESGLLEAVKEIDSEITRCIRELLLTIRKKWQGSSSQQ